MESTLTSKAVIAAGVLAATLFFAARARKAVRLRRGAGP
jgi:hypothetical protein